MSGGTTDNMEDMTDFERLLGVSPSQPTQSTTASGFSQVLNGGSASSAAAAAANMDAVFWDLQTGATSAALSQQALAGANILKEEAAVDLAKHPSGIVPILQ